MGKKAFDWVIKLETVEFPYQNKECYVFTRSPIKETENVKFFNDDVVSFTNKLKNQEGRNIWIVGGGKLARFFLMKS